MKKLTKKQHRGIIKNLISKNEDVKELRYIQQVAELFQEEASTYEAGEETLIAADAIRLLLDLIDNGLASDTYAALYDLLENEEGDTIDAIVDILEGLDERRLYLVYAYTLAISGRKKKEALE